MHLILAHYKGKRIYRLRTDLRNITIGRQPGNDITLEYRGVSSCHATVNFNGPQIYVTDLETLNGTWYDGQKIKKIGQVIPIGDQITIEGVNITFVE